MVEEEQHRQIIVGICSLTERVSIDGRRAISLYRLSVKVRSRDAAALSE